jgi:circadian clock protein KaiB
MKQRKTTKRRPKVDLKLFVAGSGSRSLRTIDSVKKACEKHAPGRYQLCIVDIYLRPELAVEAQVVAVPTLIRELPKPLRMFVGVILDASDLDSQFGRQLEFG